MITDHFRPGQLVYMQVETAAPGALDLFTVWVAAEQARLIAREQVDVAREKAGAAPRRDEALIAEWRNIAEVQTSLANAAAQTMTILAERLREAQIDNPYGWAQEKLSALKNEAASAQNAA